MSLPSSEPLPDDIHELPPARQRHLRRMPRAASLAEWQILLESLLKLTGPTLGYFLFSLLGPLAVGAAIYFNEPVLLIVAIVLFPFNSPIFNLALLPASQKIGPAVKSLLSLLTGLILAFGFGMLTGWLAPHAAISRLPVIHFSAPYWLNLAIVVGSAFICSFVLLREDHLPRLAGALLSYEILLPVVLAGFGMLTGHQQLWPGALLVALLHLGLALVTAIFTFILIGFAPRALTGWLFGLIPLVLTLALLTATLFYNDQLNLPWLMPDISVTPTQSIQETEPVESPSPKAAEPSATATVIPTATLQPTPSPTHTEALTSTVTVTATPEPTEVYGVVIAQNGAVVRDEPSFSSPIVTYVNDGDQVVLLNEYLDGNTRWFQIRTELDETGWLLGSLINTPTPTPSATAE